MVCRGFFSSSGSYILIYLEGSCIVNLLHGQGLREFSTIRLGGSAEAVMGFSTDAIHAGQEPDKETGAVTVPIHATSTYQFAALGVDKGYNYSRTVNPTRTALETCLTALEGGARSLVFGSGMAAINAVFSMLKTGDHVLLSQNVYGGTYRLVDGVLKNFGLDCEFIDTADIDLVKKSMRPETALLFIETPTNPVLSLTDIAACAELCRNHPVKLAVDNTFMSPYLQKPLALGADLVIYSTTKYMNGHSDSLGGAVITRTQDDGERLHFIQKSAGAILSPFECWLVMRGLKTLAVRMDKHEVNGAKVAEYLKNHPKVQSTVYPGFPDHPQHELAKKQASGFGGMITFDVDGYDNAKAFLDRLQLCLLAESLGGVETLISHPASMTHASVPPEELKRIGVTPGMVRISVGIEDVEDLIEDLERGLSAVAVPAAATSS
jgi:cystathionine beta-lyase/cystathionine gamma-synthase